MDEPVICRWRDRESGLAIDVMPTSEEVLGFSNSVVRGRHRHGGRARTRRLASGSARSHPPVGGCDLARAWLGRGGGDVLKSLDVHDIIVLVDGRPELIDELAVPTGGTS